MSVRTPVYLDHHATTPLDPRVLDAVLPALREHFGNPGSASHAFGWAAEALVERAREQVAGLLGCEPREIVFTSGATESANLALKGVADARRTPGHIVTSVLEHDAVRRPLASLAERGWVVTEVGCGADGIVRAESVAEALREDTVLVSLTAAQNEIGTLQPVADVGALCRDRGILFHTDAAQAVGRVPVDVRATDVHLLGLSAHKLYGPKGVGALYVRARDPRVVLASQMDGGGQENGRRSGTVNVAGVVGLGEACRLALAEMEERTAHLRSLAARFYAAVADGLSDVRLNGAAKPRLPGSLNLLFPGTDAAGLMRELPTLAVSTGSACGGGRPGPSPAMTALGLDPREADASLRICFGKDNTEEEAAYAAATIIEGVRALRADRDA